MTSVQRTSRGGKAWSVVVGALLCAGLAACTADDGGSAADARDEAYDYPAVDFADDLRVNLERLGIPDEVLDAMSTEALVWSVLDFPYVGNAFASNQANGEVAFLATQCDALRALLGRADAAAAVDAVRSEYAEGGSADDDESGELKLRLLDLVAAEVTRG